MTYTSAIAITQRKLHLVDRFAVVLRAVIGASLPKPIDEAVTCASALCPLITSPVTKTEHIKLVSGTALTAIWSTKSFQADAFSSAGISVDTKMLAIHTGVPVKAALAGVSTPKTELWSAVTSARACVRVALPV